MNKKLMALLLLFFPPFIFGGNTHRKEPSFYASSECHVELLDLDQHEERTRISLKKEAKVTIAGEVKKIKVKHVRLHNSLNDEEIGLCHLRQICLGDLESYYLNHCTDFHQRFLDLFFPQRESSSDFSHFTFTKLRIVEEDPYPESNTKTTWLIFYHSIPTS